MYKISRVQLIEEIGDPDTIASNYISSVGRRIPSLGLRLLAAILGLVFALSIIVGAERFSVGAMYDIYSSSWLAYSGAVLSFAGAICLGLLILSMVQFERYHVLLAYLILAGIVLSIPNSVFLGGALTKNLYKGAAVVIQDYYSLLFIIDIIIISIAGLYIYLNHYSLIENKPELMV